MMGLWHGLRWTRGIFALLALLLDGGAIQAAKVPAGDPAAPPGEEERAPRNEEERLAGAVILESHTKVSGAFDPKEKYTEGEVRRIRNQRFLVFDGRGAERLSRHAFFEREAEDTATSISGRTITPDGKVHPLDPERDVRNLDTRDPDGKATVSRRTAFFPQVQPGAILELSYETVSKRPPSVEIVTLQDLLPVRKATVETVGRLQFGKATFVPLIIVNFSKVRPSVYWVPFFMGPTPPNTVIRLDREFNLTLEATDLPALAEEPRSPPLHRRAYNLGLVPRAFPATEEVSVKLWRSNQYLNGPPTVTINPVRGHVRTREIDPANGIVQLDEHGLQPLPYWNKGSHKMLTPFQASLKSWNQRFLAFMKRRPSRKQRSEIADRAPEDLPWRERAHGIYTYVREKVAVDEEAESESSPATILKKGRANGEDVALLTACLLNHAGIPSRMLYALSRHASPFQPAVWYWGLFHPGWIVEAGGGEEPHLYLSPSNRYAGFDHIPTAFLGSLAFSQPPDKKKPWPLVRIPLEVAGANSIQLEFSAPLAADLQDVDLAMQVKARGTAASTMRWLMEYTAEEEAPAAAEERKLEALRSFVDRWTNLEFTGEAPAPHEAAGSDDPYRLDLKVAWRPEIQDLGDRLLFPAFPNSDLFQNVFTEDRRASPIWLRGGTYEISMEWVLPEGMELSGIPDRLVRRGPGGLELVMWVTSQTPGKAVSRMRVSIPYIIPAGEYEAVRGFHEDLQRAGRSQLLAVAREGA